MGESRNTKIFISVSLAIAICFTVVAIAEDKTLTGECYIIMKCFFKFQ